MAGPSSTLAVLAAVLLFCGAHGATAPVRGARKAEGLGTVTDQWQYFVAEAAWGARNKDHPPLGSQDDPCKGEFGVLKIEVGKHFSSGADNPDMIGHLGVERSTWRPCNDKDGGKTADPRSECCVSTVAVGDASHWLLGDPANPQSAADFTPYVKDLSAMLGAPPDRLYAMYSGFETSLKGQRYENWQPAGDAEVGFQASGMNTACSSLDHELVATSGGGVTMTDQLYRCGLYTTLPKASGMDYLTGKFEMHGDIEYTVDLGGLYRSTSPEEYAKSGIHWTTAYTSRTG